MHQSSDPSSIVVLVVEDEALLRDCIATYLRDAGCTVLEAESGEIALGYLRRGERINVVVTDIQLRGPLDGWDVGETFRHAVADMPLIYTSGGALDSPRQAEGSLSIHKPYDARTILDACCELAGKGGRMEARRRSRGNRHPREI